jgi:hypothetical protein
MVMLRIICSCAMFVLQTPLHDKKNMTFQRKSPGQFRDAHIFVTVEASDRSVEIIVLHTCGPRILDACAAVIIGSTGYLKQAGAWIYGGVAGKRNKTLLGPYPFTTCIEQGQDQFVVRWVTWLCKGKLGAYVLEYRGELFCDRPTWSAAAALAKTKRPALAGK